MNHGVLPVKRKKTHYSTRSFGATKPSTYTPFNFDAGFGFPDQLKDGNANGCRIYTTRALCQDQDKTPYDLDYIAEKVALIDNLPAYSAGDVENALKAVCVYGPAENAPKRGKYFMLEREPGMDWFDSAIAVMQKTGSPLSIASHWPREFEYPKNGFMPEDFPTIWLPGVVGHNHEGPGLEIVDGQPVILDKSWQGPRFGVAGYTYWTRTAFNRLLDTPGVGAFLVTQWDGSITTIQWGIIYRLQLLIRLYQRQIARGFGFTR
jgi:hypothetical protein